MRNHRIRLPTTSARASSLRANVSSTIATCGVASESCAVNVRPATRGVRITSKYPGVTPRKSASMRAAATRESDRNVLPSMAPLNGSCVIAAAPVTPRISATLAVTCSKNVAIEAPVAYLGDVEIRPATKPRGEKPRSISYIRASDSVRKNVVTIAVDASAVWNITSARPIRMLRRVPVPLRVPTIDATLRNRIRSTSGSAANSSIVRSTSPNMNAATAPSTRASSSRGSALSFIARSSRGAAAATARPPALPAVASTNASASNSPARRAGPAPSAVRIASSARRASPRASSRFATFAHAITSTRPARADTRYRAGRACCSTSSVNDSNVKLHAPPG